MRFDKEVGDFIRFTGTKPGETWHLRHLWGTTQGWTVEWRCADRRLNLEGAIARKLARYLTSQFSKTFRKTMPAKRDPEKEAEILKWVDTLDLRGKEAIHNNRNNVHPDISEQVPA